MAQARSQNTASAAQPVRGLAEVASDVRRRGLPPVHLWNPPFCGDIDMRIGSDGTWYYMGTPIGRKRMVQLFSSVLRRDDDGKTYLVTPVEKVGIRVDDAPFLAVAMQVEGAGRDCSLRFTTNVGDTVVAGADHPLRFETEPGTGGLKPYVLVRGRLEALVARAITYDLVELAGGDGTGNLGVWSGGAFFPIESDGAA